MDPSRDPGRGARPEVWVNCAASFDGRLAYADGARARLSSSEDLVRVQKLRRDSDAILVGVGTVVKDDPSLRVHWELLGEPVGRNPTRVVVDGSGRTPESARVLDQTAPTIIATSRRSTRHFPPHVRVVVCGERRVEIPELFLRLHDLGVRRILVEGGAAILSSVLRSGLFDRLTVYTAPVGIGGATAPPVLAGPETRGSDETVDLHLVGIDRVGEGFVATYTPRRDPEPRPAPLG